jgi:hypothetical protein
MEYNLVGIIGKAGSGKDKFFSTVLAKYNYTRLALADPVKVITCFYLLNSIPIKDEKDRLRLFSSVYKEVFSMDKSSLIRILLQQVGTEVAREQISPDFWIDIATPLVLERLEKKIKVAITDIRFINEAKWIKSLGGYIIKIENKGKYSDKSNEANHASEKELEDIKYDFTSDEFEKVLNQYYE